MSKIPDRPIECCECKKPPKVHYTFICDGNIQHTGMCKECPNLLQHLKGSLGSSHISENNHEISTFTGLCCGNCGTTLDSIRMGTPLGCPECYEVFSDILIQEGVDLLNLTEVNKKTNKLLHIGRSPGELQEIPPSVKLLALNEALDETLVREDYEQAAWLRDQIRAITEKVSHGKTSK